MKTDKKLIVALILAQEAFIQKSAEILADHQLEHEGAESLDGFDPRAKDITKKYTEAELMLKNSIELTAKLMASSDCIGHLMQANRSIIAHFGLQSILSDIESK